MISTAKVKQWFFEKGKRILKVSQFGAKTAKVAAPFGDDANPIKDMTAIFAETSESGEPFILGYVNTDQLAAVGEKRIFSLKETGGLSTYIWLKNNGTIEIGGKADNAVRFSKLNEAIGTKDSLITSELAKIATAIGTLGGTYVPGKISTDLEPAKIDEVKTL